MPVELGSLLKNLPRKLSNDLVLNVCIKKHIFHMSGPFCNLINVSSLHKWLVYLAKSPLYKRWNIHMYSKLYNSFNMTEMDVESSHDEQMPVLICKGDHYVNVKCHLRVRVADLGKHEDEGLLSLQQRSLVFSFDKDYVDFNLEDFMSSLIEKKKKKAKEELGFKKQRNFISINFFVDILHDYFFVFFLTFNCV